MACHKLILRWYICSRPSFPSILLHLSVSVVITCVWVPAAAEHCLWALIWLYRCGPEGDSCLRRSHFIIYFFMMELQFLKCHFTKHQTTVWTVASVWNPAAEGNFRKEATVLKDGQCVNHLSNIALFWRIYMNLGVVVVLIVFWYRFSKGPVGFLSFILCDFTDKRLLIELMTSWCHTTSNSGHRQGSATSTHCTQINSHFYTPSSRFVNKCRT